MMAVIQEGQLTHSSQQQHNKRLKKRAELFLKGPTKLQWLRDNIPDPMARLVLVARAFSDIENTHRVKLTRKIWECAGITDKDTRSRVINKISRRCPTILVDAQRGRCTPLEFKSL